MNEEDCGLFMLPDLQDNSNDLRMVDRLSIVTSRLLNCAAITQLFCERCNHSEESIYLSQYDFLILLALG